MRNVFIMVANVAACVVLLVCFTLSEARQIGKKSYEIDCGTQFQCPEGFCIPPSWKCDYVDDCGDNADEEGCDFECPADTWMCNNGRCIDYEWICDGQNDCDDNSDENGCVGPTPDWTIPREGCTEDEFQCENHHCVPWDFVCDRYDDCEDNSDEFACIYDCGPHLWTCETGVLQCINPDYRCDGEKDCSDGSDERDCRDKNKNENEVIPQVPWRARDKLVKKFYN